jgi:flagellar biosynthesis/type III secretory pathway protein FliH
LFREAFIWHVNSLEFRAKLLAATISATNSYDECDKELLIELSNDIYTDSDRAVTLVNITEEIVEKVLNKEYDLDINKLIYLIDKELKKQPRFIMKINIEKLRKFQTCKKLDEEGSITQERVLEFLENFEKEVRK